MTGTRRARDAAGRAGPRAALRTALLAGVLGGVLISGSLVGSATYAAFTGSTASLANTFAAGQVAISDDDSNGLLVSVTGAKPGDTGTNCIKVSYTGSIASTVKMSVSASSGSLRPYLQLTVARGPNGTYGDCTGHAPAESVNTTLNSFAGAYPDGSGWGSWAPASAGDMVYRITWLVLDDDLGQGTSATFSLKWQAQST